MKLNREQYYIIISALTNELKRLQGALEAAQTLADRPRMKEAVVYWKAEIAKVEETAACLRSQFHLLVEVPNADT